jgi:muconolactone delta-isomerase
MEYLVGLEIEPPAGTPSDVIAELRARESERVYELADQGNIVRLWRPPAEEGQWRALGLWRAGNEDELRALVNSLPLSHWFTVSVTPLSPHPNDPERVVC